MESYKYLLDIALILISTKILGLLTRRIQLPQVVGALIAGLLLGPACFGVLQETDFIKNIAEIGVIVLMFAAGLETDVQELKKTGLASFIIALHRRYRTAYRRILCSHDLQPGNRPTDNAAKHICRRRSNRNICQYHS